MKKFTLVAGAMLMAAPAIAQQAPTGMEQLPPSSAAPVQMQTPPSTAPAEVPATQAQGPATPAPVSGTDQIAQVVDVEFPTYDKDGNGSLNTAEFGTWMVALRSATDKSVTAESKSMKAWAKSAFAQADADKSKSITKIELTGFLAQPKG